jgi:hypothetical protein
MPVEGINIYSPKGIDGTKIGYLQVFFKLAFLKRNTTNRSAARLGKESSSIQHWKGKDMII